MRISQASITWCDKLVTAQLARWSKLGLIPFNYGGELDEELISVGRTALCEARHSYVSFQRYKFRSYARPHVINAMKRFLWREFQFKCGPQADV